MELTWDIYRLSDSLGNPIVDSSGNPVTVPFSLPNHVGYSSDISMAFNIGGALADISWLEAGDVPIVAIHCANDEYAPIDTGDVIVPTTGDFVVEVMGSRTVAHYSNVYGNNDVFVNAGFSDDFTNAANLNNSGYEGLYVFQTPPPSTTPNAFGELEEEQGAPWDWWDNTSYDQIFQAVNGAPAGYGAANSILGNPDMSATKGHAYIDTIQGYLNPRIYVALGLGNTNNISEVVESSTEMFPNPTSNSLNIVSYAVGIESVEIFNLNGQSVLSVNANSNQININTSNLREGVYIVNINSKNSSVKRKLVVK